MQIRLQAANQLTCEQYFDHVNILKPSVLQRKHLLNFFHYNSYNDNDGDEKDDDDDDGDITEAKNYSRKDQSNLQPFFTLILSYKVPPFKFSYYIICIINIKLSKEKLCINILT